MHGLTYIGRIAYVARITMATASPSENFGVESFSQTQFEDLENRLDERQREPIASRKSYSEN